MFKKMDQYLCRSLTFYTNVKALSWMWLLLYMLSRVVGTYVTYIIFASRTFKIRGRCFNDCCVRDELHNNILIFLSQNRIKSQEIVQNNSFFMLCVYLSIL